MKNVFLALLFIGFVQVTKAQDVAEVSTDSIYNSAIVDKQPDYPGGITAFFKLVSDNFVSPKSPDFKGGKVIVSLVVNTDGSLSDVKILRDAGFNTGEEIRKLVTASPKWIAGELGGVKVRTNYVFPIILKELDRTVSDLSILEKYPDFSGGINHWDDYIIKNYKEPLADKGVLLPDKVIIQFVVDIDGSLTDIKVLRDLGYNTVAEVKKLLENSPKWIPGERNGEKVRVQLEIPLQIYILNSDIDHSGVIYESEVVDKPPVFHDGLFSFIHYFYGSISNRRKCGRGLFVIEFVVNTDGSLQDFKVLQDVPGHFEREAIKIMKKCPKLFPAIKSGRYVRSVFRLPIPF